MPKKGGITQTTKYWEISRQESSRVHSNPSNLGYPFVTGSDRGRVTDQANKAISELEKRRQRGSTEGKG